MRAIRLHSRGGTRAMVFEEAPTPSLEAGDVLVRVHATGTTPTELGWNSTYTRRSGEERLPVIPGFEFSGTVVSSSPGVSDFAKGDEVFGLLDFWRDGAAADYVAVQASEIALKPTSIDHVRAAAIPLSGLTAWQALFDHAHVRPGDRVLIHGAAGGVGSYAVQLAHWKGAYVIGTASEGRAPFLRDLGADEVLDYSRERFEDRVRGVDTVLDTVGGDTLDRSWRTVRPGGTLVTIVGETSEAQEKEFGVRGVSMLVQPRRAELIELSRLVGSGALRPVVDAVFPLASSREAYERGAGGHNRGKVVLRVTEPSGALPSGTGVSREGAGAKGGDPRSTGAVPGGPP